MTTRLFNLEKGLKFVIEDDADIPSGEAIPDEGLVLTLCMEIGSFRHCVGSDGLSYYLAAHTEVIRVVEQ